MAVVEVKCPTCENANVIKHGLNKRGKQKYYCKDCKKIFLLEYKNNTCKPETKITIIKIKFFPGNSNLANAYPAIVLMITLPTTHTAVTMKVFKNHLTIG